MNILVLIRELDKTPLEREVRSGDAYGEIITFYNEDDIDYNILIDSVEYNNVVQICLILKEQSYYLYIQHGENPNFIKLDVDNITEIDCFSSI